MPQTIRVAMVITSYHPIVGGAEKQVATLAPLLQQEGIDIHIITRHHPGLAFFEMVNNVPVHRIFAPKPKPLDALMFMPLAALKLRQLHPDVIHAHSLLSPLTTAILAKKMSGTPVVAKVLRGGTLGDLMVLKHKKSGERRLSFFRHNVDRFIAISHEIERELAEVGMGPQQRIFIPNGVDTCRFQPVPPPEKAALRGDLGLPSVDPIVIFTGRLAPEKGIDQLIGIWPKVQAVHPKALLLILGAGNYEAELKKQAGGGIKFGGVVDDVAPYMKAADIFVLPSVAEGLSNAMLEAMATGLPAIVTNVGASPDVINHGENGWLISPNDPDGLLQGLLPLLADPAERIRLGQNARATMERNFAVSTVVSQLKNLYTTLSRPLKNGQ